MFTGTPRPLTFRFKCQKLLLGVNKINKNVSILFSIYKVFDISSQLIHV